MTIQTLTINYAAPQPMVDPYWIRIEQDAVEDGATVSQTAAVLDALFEIDACAEQPAETTPAPTAPVEQAQAADSMAEVVDLPACAMDPDGSVQTSIRVYRSHLAEPYTLRLRGGTAVETIQVDGPVTAAMEISETITLDYPVVSGFTCTPAPLQRVGNTLRFAAEHIGALLSVSYQSRWDRVTVRITGIDGETGECRALAFHHGLAAALDLQTPEILDIDRNLCPAHRYTFDPTDYEVTCYKIIEVTQRCTCSGDEVGSYTTEQVVPCPNPEMRCPNNETTCMHLLATEAMDEWVDCAGDSEVPGRPGEVYALSTPAYYEDHCCKPPSMSLPQCPTKRTVYKTDLPIEYGQAYWRGIYGQGARFIPVSPPGGICGEWIVEQLIDSANCCDGIPPLAWDQANSAETLSPSSSGTVRVTGGGRYDYEWSISGTGFSFASGNTGITSVPYISVQAAASACGTATITCTDGCSSTSFYVRSTAGRWVRVYIADGGITGDADTPPFTGGCPIAANGTAGAGGFGSHIDEAISGKYKVRQGHYFGSLQSGNNASRAAAITWCNNQTPPYSSYQLTGMCFYYAPLCISGCGVCENLDFFDDASWANRSVGKHSAITNYRYVAKVGWPVITFTTVDEWQC
jgi:hypothetical protein